MPSSTPDPARHYAMLLFGDFGHIAPTLGVTRELLARGHRVTYVVDETFAAAVEESGARAVTYASARGDFYRAADPSPDRLAHDGYNLLLDTIRTVFPLARDALAADPPDVVLYDFETVAASTGSPPESSAPYRCRSARATRPTRRSRCAPRCGTPGIH